MKSSLRNKTAWIGRGNFGWRIYHLKHFWRPYNILAATIKRMRIAPIAHAFSPQRCTVGIKSRKIFTGCTTQSLFPWMGRSIYFMNKRGFHLRGEVIRVAAKRYLSIEATKKTLKTKHK